MRFRFSLRSLLILPPLLALSIAWVTWPTRTYESFCSAIRDGNFEQVNAMVECADCQFEYKATPKYPTGGIHMKKSGSPTRGSYNWPFFLETCITRNRSLADVIMARSSFEAVIPNRPSQGPYFEFVIERGQLTMHYCVP